MSTKAPPTSNIPSMSRMPRPLSITCVRPSARGLPGRAGRLRKSSVNPLEPGNDLLQSFVRRSLDVVVERISVRVDADRERSEVPDAELPEALGHEVFPGDLLDRVDL